MDALILFAIFRLSAMAEKVWLTFMNSGGLTEPQIRAELEVFGSVLECDGAIGGEGWVMVAMADKQEADKAVKCLKVGLKPCDCKPLTLSQF